jgi:hypothetical protein
MMYRFVGRLYDFVCHINQRPILAKLVVCHPLWFAGHSIWISCISATNSWVGCIFCKHSRLFRSWS